MGKAVGIDLGTTYSAISIIGEDGFPYIIKNAEGEKLTPSVVYFEDGKPVVGREAKEMQAFGTETAVSLFKRSMGDANYIFCVDEKEYTPVDLSTMILRKLKVDAESELDEEITHAVITVPAYFSDFQRRNTISAGENAGFTVLRIINEPTAAAIAFGADKFKDDITVLVYDLGGGTFDISMIKISKDEVEVIATDGNHELGGKDWDDAILRYFASQFEEQFGEDPFLDSVLINDLMVKAEATKIALSNKNSASFSITSSGKTARYEINRNKFAQLAAPLMEATISLVDQVLIDANYQKEDIDGILFIGGSTRMPMIEEVLSKRYDCPILKSVDPDEAVSLGAAIQANIDMHSKSISGSKNHQNQTFFLASKTIKDVMSHSLGIVAIKNDKYVNAIIIGKNKPIPSIATLPLKLRTSSKMDNQMEVYLTQGESERPLDNQIIGLYRFSGISHNKNNAVIKVSYEYDENGIIQVSGKESNGQSLNCTEEPIPEDLSWLDRTPEIHQKSSEHISLYFAIDLSGSMSGTPLKEAKKAANSFVSNMDLAHSSIGVIGVSDEVKIFQYLSQNAKKITQAIDNMTDGSTGYGNSAQPFTEAYKLLEKKEGARFILVLADGVWSYQDHAVEEAKKCHKEGIDIIAIGFGGADKQFLKDISSSDENALFADLSTLTESFTKIAQVLTENTSSMQRL